jgi:hypothetical protein
MIPEAHDCQQAHATAATQTHRQSTGKTVEQNEGLDPHMRWTKIPDCVHVYRGISPMNRVFFHASAVCLIRPTQARRIFK